MLWKLPGFLIYLYIAQENVFKVILGCNIDVLWDEKIAAPSACTRNGTADLEVHLEKYEIREEIFTYLI
jgi:hypothetical protein